MNARDEYGIVHEVDKQPKTHADNENHLVQGGFTWCMQFFTWVDGPRWHPPSDQVEGRFERVDEHPTCLTCVIHPAGYI